MIKRTHRYPAECPVFEVLTNDYPDCCPQGLHFTGEPYYEISNGKGPHTFGPREVRPLTRAAREMLAVVKDGA